MKWIVFLFFPFVCFGFSLVDLHQELDSAGPETLVVFDVDGVLIESTLPALQCNASAAHRPVLKKLFAHLSPDVRGKTLILSVLRAEAQLVDAHIFPLLEHCRENQIPTIALTHFPTGPFAEIPSMEMWRYSQLLDLGLDFSTLSNWKEHQTFYEFSPWRNQYPRFVQGILFANGGSINKGNMLVAFLERVEHRPQRVIFLDDRKRNVEDMEQALHAFDPQIDVQAIHYCPGKCMVTADAFAKAWSELIEEAKRMK